MKAQSKPFLRSRLCALQRFGFFWTLCTGLGVVSSVLTQAASPPAGADKTTTLNEDVPYTFTESDYGFSDALDIPPNVFSRVKISRLPTAGTLRVDGAVVTLNSFISISPVATTTWLPHENVRNWSAVATSDDGQKLVAVESGGFIYSSSDGGVNWLVRDAVRTWQGVASSSDGIKLAAVVSGGMIYTSTDSGATWTSRASVRNWRAIAGSADGVKLVAVETDGQIYVSGDSGVTWVAVETNRKWQAVASSADGAKLVAMVNGGQIYTSTNSGAAWTARDSARVWQAVASSSNGTKLVAAVNGGQLYNSSNSGVSWTARDSTRAWQGVASSGDGTRLVAVVQGGLIYASSNSGLSWTSRPYTRAWKAVASSADGNHLIAAVASGQLHISVPTVPTLVYTPSANAFGTPYTNFGFQVEDDGTVGSNLDATTRTFTININSVNDAPVAANLIADQTLPRGVAYGFIFPATTFSDADTGTVLTYAATQADGSPLPAWLTFTPSTRRFSGTPGANDAKVLEVKVLATDNGSPPLTGMDQFAITLLNPPSGTDGTVAMVEETSHVFSPADFGFSDAADVPPDQFVGFKVASQPSRGNLTLNQNGVFAGDFLTWEPTAGARWIEHELSRTWTGIASSFDGMKLIACVRSGYLYTSADRGETWTPQGSTKSWEDVASSADGNNLLAAGEFLFTSTDAGVTWTQRAFADTWKRVASSADGTRLVAVSNSGALIRSSDSGVTWSAPDNTLSWQDIVSSADGNKLAARAIGPDGLRIFTSTNAGSTWSSTSVVIYWVAVATSADGNRLVAVTDSGLYTSVNGGGSWLAQNVTPSFGSWNSLASSADGMKLVASTDIGMTHTSHDGGVNWVAWRNYGVPFSLLASTADGDFLVTLGESSRICTSIPTLPEIGYTPEVNGAGLPYDSFLFQVQDSGQSGFNRDPTPNTMTIHVTNVNDPPGYSGLPLQSAPFGQAFHFTLPGYTFYDFDEGTVFSYVVSLENGDPLPAWLQFNTITNTFSGTPTVANRGTITIRLTVTDNGQPSLSATGTFQLNVPTAFPLGTDRAFGLNEDTQYSISLSDYGFSDPQDVPPNRFVGVKLTTLPAMGQLLWNGSAVSLGTTYLTSATGRWFWRLRSSFQPLALAVSEDALRIATIRSTAGIYTSSDTGASFLARDISTDWQALACSADGLRLVAAKLNGGIFTSTDAGITWILRDGTPRQWRAVASSVDGMRLVGVVQQGRIYTSADGGVTWAERESDRGWRAVASSVDGQSLIAMDANYTVVNNLPAGTTGRLYTSSDAGVTWTARETDRYWSSVASSANGTRLIAAERGAGTGGGQLLTSADGGVTWVPQGTIETWKSVVSSANGQVLAALSEVGNVSVSRDAGVTWTAQTITSVKAIALTADGSMLIASNFSGISTAVYDPPPLVYVPPADGSGNGLANFTFQVIDDGLGNQSMDPIPNTFTFNVTPVDDGPRMANPIPDQVTQKLVPLAFQFAANTFSHPDGIALAYTASLEDGSPLPAWLSFNGGTRTFSGTPAATDIRSVGIRVIAIEQRLSALSVPTTFRLTVRNEEPAGTDRILTIQEDEIYPFAPADFGFTDPNDTPANLFRGVKIASLPAVGQLRLDGVPVLVGSYLAMSSQDLLHSWTPRESVRAWRALAVSADGSTIGAAANNGPISISRDAGVTWSAGSLMRNWTALAVSADGMKWAAGAEKLTVSGVDQPTVYLSSDAGLTWAPASWALGCVSLAVSADGQVLAGIFQGTSAGQRIYLSRNAGLTWLPREGMDSFKDIAISADGQTVLVGGFRPNISRDGGETWTAYPGVLLCDNLGMSADGTRMVLIASNAQPQFSSDGGRTWAPRGPAQTWGDVACSADGRTILAAGQNRLSRSTDEGLTWYPMGPQQGWSRVALSADGKLGAALANQVQVHVSRLGTSLLTYQPATNAFGNSYASFDFHVDDDGIGGATLDFTPNKITFHVLPVNDAPQVVTRPSNALFNDLQAGTYTVFTTNFSDLETASTALVYSMTRADDSPLPAWLSFNSSTRQLRGTPQTADVGTLALKITATDNGTPPLSASVVIQLIVSNIPNEPQGSDRTLSLFTNQIHTFSAENFGFSDTNDQPPNLFTRARIASLPAAGQLIVEGRPAVVGDYAQFLPIEAGTTWTPRESTRSWYSVCCSADGTRMGAVDYTGKIYLSTDSGVTWTPRHVSANWYGITCSADGLKWVAVAKGGQIHTSTDGGITWIAHENSREWRAVASSADGTKLAAIVQGGQIYTSTDSGVTWTARESNRTWYFIASSQDGVRLAAVERGGKIYTSADGGVSWQGRESIRTWRHIASSADGSKLAAVVDTSGQIYTSVDYGETWIARESSQDWSGICATADGTRLCAVASSGLIYLSSDFGVTWSPRATSSSWRHVACSADGSKLVTCELLGRIFTTVASQPNVLTFTPANNQNGAPYASFTFQVEDDGPVGSNLDRTPNTLILNVTAPSPFQTWAITKGLPTDPNANGGTNLLNFAFGLPPQGAAGEITVAAGVITQRGTPTTSTASTPNGVDFQAVFGRRKNSGLSYTVQFSAALQQWENSPATATVIADDGEMEACSVPYPFFLSDGQKARFFRVSVSP